MLKLFADVVIETHRSSGFEWDVLHMAIALIVVLAVVAIVYVVTRAMGWAIPDWLVKIVVICAVAVVGIIALKFLWSLF